MKSVERKHSENKWLQTSRNSLLGSC